MNKTRNTSIIEAYRRKQYAWGGTITPGNPQQENDGLYKALVKGTTPSQSTFQVPSQQYSSGGIDTTISSKQAGGGNFGTTASSVAPAVLGTAAEMLPETATGRKSVGSYALKGAASGAAMGSVIGPWGTVIGAGVGAVAGWIGGASAKKKEGRMLAEMDKTRAQSVRQNSANRIYNDPGLVAGYTGGSYFAEGGQMGTNIYQDYVNSNTKGGSLQALGSQSVEVNGNTHAEGGVNLPAYNAEVEDGETIYKDYVFSKKLGFADRHKPIAKAIAKIEGKTMSPERLTSLRRLEEKTERLKGEQELVKSNIASAGQYAEGGFLTGGYRSDTSNIPRQPVMATFDNKTVDPYLMQRARTVDSLGKAWNVPTRDIISVATRDRAIGNTLGPVRNTRYEYNGASPRQYTNYSDMTRGMAFSPR